MVQVPIEFWIIGVVTSLYFVTWIMDKIKGALWRRSKSAKEGDHVRALVVQQFLAKAYEKERSFSPLNNTMQSKDERPIKAKPHPR